MEKREFLATAIGMGAMVPSRLIYAAEQTSASSLFRTAPYLQNVGGTAATLMWLTVGKCHSWVEWGDTEALGKKSQAVVDGQVVANNTLNKIKLIGLTPGQRYFYRVGSREIIKYGAYKVEWGETQLSEIQSFHTDRPQSTTLKTLFFNDIHDHLDLFNQLVQQVDGFDHDLAIFNGDCFNDPASEEQVLHSLNVYNRGIAASRKPVVYLRGNHEIRGAYSRQWPDLVDNPGGRQYFSMDRGPVHFVFLDCGEDKPDSHWAYSGLNDFEGFHREQAQWLEGEIETPEFKQATYRVLVHHIPIYGLDEKYNPWKKLWSPILNRAGFDLSFHGHTHKVAIHPPGTAGNHTYPVIIGGGKKLTDGTVTTLLANKKELKVTLLNARGEPVGKYHVKNKREK